MSYLLYVSNLPDEITLDDLIIYFQSSKSGGGDVEYEACKLDGNNAVVAFEEDCLENVLRKSHTIKEQKLEISDKLKPTTRAKPVPKKRTSLPASKREEKTNRTDNEGAYLGEVRTVIVKGLSTETTDETVQLFFENGRRTGGGEIENVERCKPDIAYITFASAEVAARVLKNVKLELEGYLLQLKEKQPELILPKDRKKLYVENLNPKTSKDSLTNYMEVRTKKEVCDVQRGDNGNALITFDEEPDINKVMEKQKPLEGSVLKISNPPVCNSILISGLTKNTTKDTIEMYFENEKNGGAKIYGDVIYQKDKGKAVVSFCNPQVSKTLIEREHKLNGASLTVCQHYQFLNAISETTYRTIKLNPDVLDHAIKKCEEKILARFGAETLEVIQERKEEIQLPEEVANEIEKFMEQFTVEEIPFCKKLLDASKDELKKMVTTANERNVTITIEEELPQMKIVGMKKYTKEIYEHFKKKIHEMEKELDVVIQRVELSKHKLELFLLHDFHGMLESKFQVSVKIQPRKGGITIEGPKEQVSAAVIEAYKRGNGIVENNVDLSDAEKHFLEKGGLDLLNNGMKTKGLKGMISLNGERGTSKAKVVLFEGTTIDDVQSYLNRNMSVKKYSLEEDSLTLLKSNKWKEFCENSKAETSIMIYLNGRSPSEISLVGKIQEGEKVYESLNNFMTRNTIVKESVDMDEGYVAYLDKYCRKNLKEVQTKLEEHSVKIHLIEHDGKVNIHGTKEGVREAKKRMDDIITTIAGDEMCFDKQRDQEYLESEQGTAVMDSIERKHECLIRLIKDDGERSGSIASSRPNQPSKFFCSYETQERISLKVLKDDLVAHSCDVMVNAANGDLNHIGGVAKAILDAGGEKIQEECDAFVKAEGPLYPGEYFSGSPGKLPCKRLIHAVGPRWDASKRQKICNLLRVTCTRVLEEAKDYRSIALPAIGSGIFGIPKETCAEIMIEAAEKFAQKNPDSALKDIRFVNNDDLTCQVFLKKFRENFLARSTFTDNQTTNYTGRKQPRGSGRERPEVPRSFGSSVSRSRPRENGRKNVETTVEVPPKRTPGDFIVTKRNMKISVVVGDLSTYKAEVLVNTTGESLKLDSNPCSKALSNEAGPLLQAECTKIGKLQVGQVAETSGGNLLCDKVYHVVCVQWNEGQGEQALRSIVKNCLKKCNSSGKSSIAFPAIGTGILGFPRDVAAKVFFEETKEFEKKVSNCNIKEVSFVVYNQDAKSIEAFKSELKKQPEFDDSEPAEAAPVPSKRRTNKRMNLNSVSGKNDSLSRSKIGPEERDDGVTCVRIGKDKEIEIAKGDITKETTDVIAHLTNPQLIMNGGVAKALARAGGQEIIRECKVISNSVKFIDSETTVLTAAGQLDVKYLAHMVGLNDPTYNEIENCITNCLETVNGKECESISFPAVGTGSLKHDPTKAATTILTSVKRFLDSNPESLRLVRIVLKDDDLVTAFQQSAKKLTENEEPGMWRRFTNYFMTKPDQDSTTISVKQKPAVNRKKLSLEIYAKDDDTVGRVKQRIQKLLEEQNKKDILDDDNIEKLSKQQVTEIKELCYMNDLKVSVEQDLQRIIVTGHGDDISKTFTQIHKMLRRIGEMEKEKEKAALHADWAEIVSQAVQWYCVDPASGDHEEYMYDKQTNAMIEKAYNKKEKSVIFFCNDEKCEIVFDDMEETNLKTNDTMKVIRKDLKAEVSVPEYWEAQRKDANGKDVVVHLVTLNPNDPKNKDEYKTISDHFHQTAPQQRILQIQRVQNPFLFKQYSMKKQSLDDKGGSNEMCLFHGTNGNNLNEINKKGLNRSFAGNTNGAAFGKGVYFARDASMSVSYAPTMSDGKRYMYYTKAAVGQYTLGNPSMVVPPPKGGSGTDSYDSTVNNVGNPTIFVLFYDSQYYPEYLITFN